MFGGPDAPPPSVPSQRRCPPPPFSWDAPFLSPHLSTLSGTEATGSELSTPSPGADQEDHADG